MKESNTMRKILIASLLVLSISLVVLGSIKMIPAKDNEGAWCPASGSLAYCSQDGGCLNYACRCANFGTTFGGICGITCATFGDSCDAICDNEFCSNVPGE